MDDGALTGFVMPARYGDEALISCYDGPRVAEEVCAEPVWDAIEGLND